MKTLVPLLKQCDHLDISFKCRGPWSDLVRKMKAIVEPVRWQKRAMAVSRESVNDRPAIFGAALTKWAGGEFHETSALLSENTDLLCCLMSDPSPVAPQRRRIRQPETHSLPEPKKQKRS